jgi:hypothetical protein
MSDTTTTPETADTELTPTDRRALLRKIAIGGAGAAAGAVMLSNGRASADDGDALTHRSGQRAQRPTILESRRRLRRTTEGEPLSVGGQVPRDRRHRFPAAVGGYGNGDVANGVHGSTIKPRPASASSPPTSLRTRTRARHRRRRRSPSPHPAHTSSSLPEPRPVRRTARTSPVSCTSTRTARCGSRCRHRPQRTTMRCASSSWRARRRRVRSTPSTLSVSYDSRQAAYAALRA